jgi:hypothetical protein
MSIFFSIEDREGEPLTEAFELMSIPKRFPRDSGHFLRYLGEAEDASFNALQAPGLMAELEALEALSPKLNEAEQKELKRVLSVCGKHISKRHMHLRFYAEGGQ